MYAQKTIAVPQNEKKKSHKQFRTYVLHINQYTQEAKIKRTNYTTQDRKRQIMRRTFKHVKWINSNSGNTKTIFGKFIYFEQLFFFKEVLSCTNTHACSTLLSWAPTSKCFRFKYIYWSIQARWTGMTWGQHHGGRWPSNDDSLHSPTVIPPSSLDKLSIMKRYHRRRTCSHTSPHRSPTMVTLHDTRFVECR